MYMCPLAGRSCAGASWQPVICSLQNPQFRQQMTSMRAVVGVVCRWRFKGLTGRLLLGLAKQPFQQRFSTSSLILYPSIHDHPASSPLNLKLSAWQS